MRATNKQGMVLFNKQLRNTSEYSSDGVDGAIHGPMLVAAYNTHNQIVTIQYQGGFKDNAGTMYWFDIGSAVSLSATTGEDVQTLTDPWPHLRVQATAASTPASGALNVFWAWREATS